MTQESEVYIFMHMPKCAGTTLVKHLEGSLDQKELMRMYRDERMPKYVDVDNFLNSIPEAKKKTVRVVYGHSVRYGMDKVIDKKPRYFTFLRDPASRAVSHYNFSVMNHMLTPHLTVDPVAVENGKIIPFEEWFSKNDKLHNFMNRMLLGEFQGRKDPGVIGDQELEESKEILKNFYFVGLTESFDQDVRIVLEDIGIKSMPLEKNISVKYIRVNDNIEKLVREKCDKDYKLYEYALQLNKKFKESNR